MVSLIAKDLIVGWDKTPVAKLASLTVNAGEIVVIAGPNGAGKSTAVKTMAKQIRPQGGSIHIDQADISEMTARDFSRMVAYVPQLIEVPHRMTVDELVCLGRNPHQQWWSWQSSDSDSQAVNNALGQTELLDLRHRAVADLSGGERQRAAIAMAIAQETKFILLDEPTAHLDFRHQLQLLDLLKQMSATGLGILLVLHDLNLTARLADRVVLLAKTLEMPLTSIVAEGPPAEVFSENTLRSVYQVDVAILNDSATGIVSYMPTRPL